VFARLGRVVVGNPWKVIAAWVVVAAALIVFAPTLNDITNTDQTSFLPDEYESVQAQQIADSAFAQATGATANVVVKRQDGGALTAADQQTVTDIAGALGAAKVDTVSAVQTSAQSLSENKQVQLINVSFDGTSQDQPVLDAVTTLRDRLDGELDGTDLKAGITGEAAISLDTMEKFLEAEAIVGIVTSRSARSCRSCSPSCCSGSAPTTSCSCCSATGSGCARGTRASPPW
jgi:RND superfamily putative drug exporter